MANAAHVAGYILRKQGVMPHMKLQKLVYYAQAWSLVWDDAPLFDDPIQAWANGPVIPNLYCRFQGKFNVQPSDLNSDDSALTDTQRETIDAVLKHYGSKSSQWLSELTHAERPWLDAREGLPPGARSNREITLSSMAEYYGSLV